MPLRAHSIPLTIPLILALALLACAVRPASAGERVLVSLDYRTEHAHSCPGAVDFQKAVRGNLHWDPFRETAPRHIVVRIESKAGQLEGRIEWLDPTGQSEGARSFSSRTESCAAFSRTMALATAIQIQLFAAMDESGAAEPRQPSPAPSEENPEGTAQATAPPPPVPQESPPPAAPPPPPPPPPPEAPSPPAPPRADLPVVVEAPAEAPELDSRFAVELSGGLLQDASDAPRSVLPRLVVLVGRPSSLELRFLAGGFGPRTEVKEFEGTAQLDRFVATAGISRFFRSRERLQPLLTAGVGLHMLHVHGTSAVPAAMAAAHDGQVLSALFTAGGGLAVALSSRICLVAEVEAMLFLPAANVQIGSFPRAAHLNGLAALGSGGLLVRF